MLQIFNDPWEKFEIIIKINRGGIIHEAKSLNK